MNLEEIRRVNLLAKELQQHRMACSSNEAVDKANKIIKFTDNHDMVKDEIINIHEQNNLDNNSEIKKNDELNNFNDLEMFEKRLRLIVEQTNNKVINEIKSVKNYIYSLAADTKTTINSLIKEINYLKYELEKSKYHKQIEVATESSRKELKESSELKVKIEADKPELKNDIRKDYHPRIGSFRPEDVSIEKFFYFGQK